MITFTRRSLVVGSLIMSLMLAITSINDIAI